MIEDRVKEVTGRDDIEIVGGDNPTICGYVSLVPMGLLGGYVIFDDGEKTYAAPVPLGIDNMDEYYAGKTR